MASRKADVGDVAGGFSISGLLDASSRTRERHPVAEIPVAEIADHPGNGVYSMDEEAVAKLAESIREHGLTDLPLVRKMEDGSWQMVSGHRRKAAYALLAAEDASFATIPCRIASGLRDEEALALLHAANLFTRQLTSVERAAATRALGGQVERMRAEDPALSGVRTEDIKAAIITAATGRETSGKKVQRDERLARMVDESLDPSWQPDARAGRIPDKAVLMLSRLPKADQRGLYGRWRAAGVSKQGTCTWLRNALADGDAADPRLEKAAALLESYSRSGRGANGADRDLLARIERLGRDLRFGGQRPA